MFIIHFSYGVIVCNVFTCLSISDHIEILQVCIVYVFYEVSGSDHNLDSRYGRKLEYGGVSRGIDPLAIGSFP